MKIRHSLLIVLIIVFFTGISVHAGPKAITLRAEEDDYTVVAGETIHLYFAIGGWKATDEQPTEWKSSDPKVAVVSSSGEVSGVSAGTAEISANTKYGWVSETITVTAAQTSSQGSSPAKGRKALKAYSKFLSKESIVLEKKEYLMETCVFDTLYLNNDARPELFIRVSRVEGSAKIFRWALYTYRSGKVKLVETDNMGILGGYGNDFSYYRRKGIFCEQYTHGDNQGTYYSKMRGMSLIPVLRISAGYDYDMDGWNSTYYKYNKEDWKKISKKAFDNALKKYVKSVKETKLVLHPNNEVSRKLFLK